MSAAASVSPAIPLHVVDRMILEIDERLAAQVNDIVHHPAFQSLEAAWRGLQYVVDHVAFEENVRVSVWDYSKEEALVDFEDAGEVVKTRFFATVYTAEYGTFGGEPYGAVFAGFYVDSSPRDVALLRGLASVSAMAHAPTLLGASPAMLRLDSFDALPTVSDLEAGMADPAFVRWRSLRESDDSRYLGVLLPRFLARIPYEESATRSFRFREDRAPSHHLWASAVFPFAVRLADSFAKTRSYDRMLGPHETPPPATSHHPALGPGHLRPTTEIVLSDRLEQSLTNAGFIPLTCDPTTRALRLTSANSIQVPKEFGRSEGGPEATLNYLLSTRLPYLFVACRIAHYLKVIDRDRIGVQRTHDELEQDLNEWLSKYVVDMDGASAAVRAQYPLRRARVRVSKAEGNAGWYRIEIHLRPHLKYLGTAFTLSIAGRLDRP